MARAAKPAEQSAPAELLDAHYRFMQDVREASAEFQQRVQAVTLEYQSAVARASQSQDPADAGEAAEAWRELTQLTWGDRDTQARVGTAYGRYVTAVGELLMQGEPKVDPSVLAAASQSMATVSACAAQLLRSGVTATESEAT